MNASEAWVASSEARAAHTTTDRAHPGAQQEPATPGGECVLGRESRRLPRACRTLAWRSGRSKGNHVIGVPNSESCVGNADNTDNRVVLDASRFGSASGLPGNSNRWGGRRLGGQILAWLGHRGGGRCAGGSM